MVVVVVVVLACLMSGAWCHFVQPAKLKEKRAAVASLPPTARKVTEMMEAMVPPMA